MWVPEGKDKRIKRSFTACRHYTYGKISVYNFVDCRSRHACGSNYRRPYLASRRAAEIDLFEKHSPGMGYGYRRKKKAVSVIMLRAQFGSHNSVFEVRVLFFISVSQTKAAV